MLAERRDIDVADASNGSLCERCGKAANVRIVVKPLVYVCVKCLESVPPEGRHEPR
jgi:hypothetical protein